jgi:hypothetical protein
MRVPAIGEEWPDGEHRVRAGTPCAAFAGSSASYDPAVDRYRDRDGRFTRG